MRIKKIIFLFLFAISTIFCFSQEKKINVYAFVAEECPISIFMASSLKSVADMYAGKVNFYLVFPFSTSTHKSATAFKTKNQLTRFILKVDKDQRITKKTERHCNPRGCNYRDR